jgi:hypothetical protein
MSPDTIKSVLSELGYNLVDRGSYWQTNALFRNGDNSTAIQIYKNSGVWKDYVSGTSFMPFKTLIQATLKTNDKEIINKYLKNIDTLDLDSVERQYKPTQKIMSEEIYPKSDIDKFLPHYKFYENKGISKSILQKLKSGFCTEGKMHNRFVFPIFNESGMIHGLAGRDMLKDAPNRPKWKHMGQKNNWIYPLYDADSLAREYINNKEEVILVESIGDLLSLHESGIYNCLVTFGLSVSPKMICALVSLAPKKIILSFNNDSDKEENRGADACVKNYLKLLDYFDQNSLCICLPTKNDFGDMNIDEVSQWQIKLSNIDQLKQQQYILKRSSELRSNKKLAESLYKKTKKIKL